MRKKQKTNGSCAMCAALHNERKQNGEDVVWDKEVRCTKTICSYCAEQNEKCTQLFLCSVHFRQFHDST
eukprot:4281630-Ditylum_brightwellii.AAC.1